MSKSIVLPNGTKTLVPSRFAYKFCIAFKIGAGPWFSSWALTHAAALRSVAAMQKAVKQVKYKIIPL